MNVPLARSRARIAAAGCALALALAPSAARGLGLLDEPLSLDAPSRPVLVALAAAPSSDPSLDFDLLGTPPPVAPSADDRAMRRRRGMLKLHQGIGLGLVGLHLGATVVGQLNYLDKYGSSAPRTGRYELSHSVFAYSTVGVFAVNGVLALLAPTPKAKAKRGFDRVSLHKLGMAVATAGMLTQGVLGVYTDRREGYLNQQDYAKAHLAIGYATFAALGVAVGALVF